MGEKVIVLVTDRGDSKHGEISILDDSQKAERLVETLLEAGFEQDRIHVYTGRASEFQISHRPVVALVDESEPAEARAPTDENREFESGEPVTAAEPMPPVEEPAPVAEEAAPVAEAAEDGHREQPAVEAREEEPVGSQVAGPVRFSSLFRSA